MTHLSRRATRLAGLDRRDVGAAERILGARHPLTIALSRRLVVARQLLVATGTVLVGAAGLAAGVPHAGLLLGAAAFVAVVFCVALVLARRVVDDNVDGVIASGNDSVLVPAVVRKRRKLTSLEERARVARSLERLLRDARRWNEILPQFRPLPGVQCLREVGPETEAVIRLLRSDRVEVQGVALVARLLGDGISSPLYGGNPRALSEELNRIRYVLEGEGAAASEDVTARRAA